MTQENPYLVEKLKTIEVRSRKVSELLESLADTAYQGRALGEVFRIIVEMLRDEDTTIFLALAGSMSTAGMWKIIKWLVEQRYIDVLVSTGANISEDIYEAMGFSYYKGSPNVDDGELLRYKIDRFYDVFASEEDYRKMERLIMDFILSLPDRCTLSSAEFLYLFGKYLNERGIDSIVAAAYRNGVPVFSPALTDSAYGIASILALRRGKRIVLDMVRDFEQLVQIGRSSKKLAAIYIGGGVPKDYINLMTVALTLLSAEEGEERYTSFEYAVQITTDNPVWGGLSGATLEEAVSWGKISPRARKRTVYVDATIALPLIAHGLYELGIERKHRSPDFSWFLKSIQCVETK